MDKIEEARKVFDIEINALEKTRDALDETYVQILDAITNCKGKVIVTGMGKPGHIAAKLAATFASLGTPSFRLHPAEAMHGDLGMVSQNDIVIAISFSGESDEIVRILPNIKIIGAKLIGITGNPNSTLAQASDIVQVLPKFEEACYLGLAPTSSTTVALCYGDSLAVVASGIYGFQDKNYALFHPAGSLGKKLILKVDDLMAKNADIPCVLTGTLLMDAIPEMSKKKLGIVNIINKDNEILGIICDGDLRRIIEKHIDIYNVSVDEVMIKNPKTIAKNALAVDALHFIKEHSINNLPVVDSDNKLVGTITWQQIVKAGIVI
ncbi:MAG: KpsF/GutQ family sugar-phosphate isomerase [Bacilli bacterium]|nr:KpsF/GutQ family sugar-phosphate isomerase [Bacilli bacterium]